MATTFSPSRSRSTNTSPQRPLTSYSVASTIRRVTPSPDSLAEVVRNKNAVYSTPRRRASSASLARPFSPAPGEGLQGTRERDGIVLATRKSTIAPSHSPLRRQGRASPPKRLPRPISMPAAPELVPMLPVDREHERPETPTPVSPEQRRSWYSPMVVQYQNVGSAGMENVNSDADVQPNSYPKVDPSQYTGCSEDPDEIETVPKPDVAAMQSANKSFANMGHSNALFVTPVKNGNRIGDRYGGVGREMSLDSDNPFSGIQNVEELAEARRSISVGTKEGRGKRQGCCGIGCLVM